MLARLSVDVCWNRSSTQCRPNSPKLSLCDQSSCLIRSPSLLEQISALSSRSPLLRRYPHRHSLSGPYLKRFKMLYRITTPSRMGLRSIVPPRPQAAPDKNPSTPPDRLPQVAIHFHRHPPDDDDVTPPFESFGSIGRVSTSVSTCPAHEWSYSKTSKRQVMSDARRYWILLGTSSRHRTIEFQASWLREVT